MKNTIGERSLLLLSFPLLVLVGCSQANVLLQPLPDTALNPFKPDFGQDFPKNDEILGQEKSSLETQENSLKINLNKTVTKNDEEIKKKVVFMYEEKDKDYFYKQINEINQSYFVGVNKIEVYDREKSIWSKGGWFIPYANIIRLVEYNGNFKKALLHELSHNYCWKTQKYLGHSGCFLNSMVQKDCIKEFGKIC